VYALHTLVWGTSLKSAQFSSRPKVSQKKHKIRPVLTGLKDGGGNSTAPAGFLTAIASGKAAGDRAV
jgi:hypothetical protein